MGVADAQLVAAGETINKIMEDARKAGLQIDKQGDVDLGTLCSGKKMNVDVVGKTVFDIGIVLFENVDNPVYHPVYKFIERFFLSLLLKADKKEQTDMLLKNGISLKINKTDFTSSKRTISNTLEQLNFHTTFNLTEYEKSFFVNWMNDKSEVISLTIPKQYDLILGLDKKELSSMLKDQMIYFSYGQDIWPDKLKYSNSQYDSTSNTYFDNGGYYIFPKIKNGSYLTKNGDAYQLLFDKQKGRETILNLFSNADLMKKKNHMKIVTDGYMLKDSLYYTIDKLSAFMKRQGCKAYVGIENETNNEFTGTVYYINKTLLYNHLCHFIFPKEAFGKEDVCVDVELYPYIPLHNIETLYDDRNEAKKK